MITKIKVPKVDANVDEETITAWFKKPGNSVLQDEPLLEFTTDKATFEFESPASGTLLQIISPVKSILPVGYVIAIIGDPSDTIPDVTAENADIIASFRASASTASPNPTAAPPSQKHPQAQRTNAIRATPAARKLARKHHVDIALIAADKNDGAVSRNDVEAYLEQGET